MNRNIIEFANRHHGTIRKIMDQTYFRLAETVGRLDSYFPMTNYDDPELAWATFRNPIQRPLGYVIGSQDILPQLGTAGDIKILEQPTITIGAGHYWKSEDYKLMRKLELAMQHEGLGNPDQYAELFFSKFEMLAEACVNSLTKFMLDVAQFGYCNYVDPTTEVAVNLKYAAADNPEQFPPAFTGANQWNQPGTANAIRDLDEYSESVHERLGIYPEKYLIDTPTYEDILRQESTKRAVLELRSIRQTTDTVVSDMEITPEELNRAISRRARRSGANISFEIVDAYYQQPLPDGTFRQEKFVQTGRVTPLFTGMGERATVGIPETEFQGRIAEHTEMTQTLPKRTQSGAMMGGIPVVYDDRLLGGLQVNEVA